MWMQDASECSVSKRLKEYHKFSVYGWCDIRAFGTWVRVWPTSQNSSLQSTLASIIRAVRYALLAT